ncbi:putative transmembrane protein, partial [Thalictrum thalictroides]
MNLFTFLLVASSLCLIHNADAVDARNTTISTEEDLELDWQLKLRNQTPVKTIKTTAGIYDCIDIKKQPALKHPQLQNHEIRLRPTSLPNRMVSKTSSSHKTGTTILTSVDCPDGTVPIRRYKKEDLIRAKSFSDSHVSNIHPMTKEYPGQHLAILRSTKLESQYGIRATMSVNNPLPVDNTQASMAEMWVQSDVGDQMNGLQAGWI